MTTISPSRQSWCATSALFSVFHHTTVRWLLLGIMAVGGIWYVFITNSVATRGADIRRLQAELNSLKTTTAKLETQAAELQSVSQREQAAVVDNLVAVERIEYLAVRGPQTGVAVR